MKKIHVNIDAKLKHAVKVKSVKEGSTVTKIVCGLLARWIAGEIK